LGLGPSSFFLSILSQEPDKTHQKKMSYTRIVGRGYQDEKDGKGIFFDHHVFQKITKHPTVLLSSSLEKGKDMLRHFRPFAKMLPYELNYGTKDDSIQKNVPFLTNDPSYKGGLLVIPGRMKDRENDKEREIFENTCIRQALLRGQPILALCAGSWRLWQSLGVFYLKSEKDHFFKNPFLLEEVKDHANSRMISLSTKNGHTTYNSMIHGLTWNNKSLLYNFLKYPPSSMQVNSVHWKAVVCEKEILERLPVEIAAYSKNTVSHNRKNRCGAIMVPQEKTVEGFSSRFGAPLIGVQWHPEASDRIEEMDGELKNPSTPYNQNLLIHMVQAGKAYTFKQIMLTELKFEIAKADTLKRIKIEELKLNSGKMDTLEEFIFQKLKNKSKKMDKFIIRLFL
jgi:gamma-glutamyl-gamma-aminobutyrate hydrolase PuuD